MISNHQSPITNHKIAIIGSDLNRILEVYDRDSFVIKQNYMRNIFYKNENSLDEGVNGGVNDILEFIKNNPNLRAKQISDAITVPLRTCERYIKQLKDEDKIEFKGHLKQVVFWNVI